MYPAVAIIAVVVLAIVAWLLFHAYAGKAGKEAEEHQAPGDPGVETLRYWVPDAQDPTVIIAALDRAGYQATLDDVRGDKHLAVACPAGRDRERARVRSVIEEADTTSIEGPQFNPGKVTFEDEK